MSDNINKRVLLVGAGPMAIDYCKALQVMQLSVTVIGCSENSASDLRCPSRRPLFGATLDNAFASLRLTPQFIHVENV